MKRKITEDTKGKYESEIQAIREFWYGRYGRLLEEHLRQRSPKVKTDNGVDSAALLGCVLKGWLGVIEEIDTVSNLNNADHKEDHGSGAPEIKHFEPERKVPDWQKRINEKNKQEK